MRNPFTILAILWAIVIFFLSITPGNELPEVNFWEIDKFVHIGVYSILGFLTAMGQRKQYQGKIPRWRLWKVAGLGISIYGILIELIQGAFIPDRHFDVLDIIANIIGSITGISLYLIFFHKR